MRRAKGNGGRGDIPGQLTIEWNGQPASKSEDRSPLTGSSPADLVQRLKWDFNQTFPQALPEAIDAGIIAQEDAEPENVRAIHAEHARELLDVLRTLDVVLDARRRGVDPRNNKAPMLPQAKDRLAKFFETEPDRLQRWWQTQMDVYAEAFGAEAADAFGKAIRAWHALVPVVAQGSAAIPATPAPSLPLPSASPPHADPRTHHRRQRLSARLPVLKPLPSAVAAGSFGQEEDLKPVRPGPREVRMITEQHAEKLVDLLDSIAAAPASGRPALLESFRNGINAYAEDFGPKAADQLEAYVRRQASLDPGRRQGR